MMINYLLYLGKYTSIYVPNIECLPEEFPRVIDILLYDILVNSAWYTYRVQISKQDQDQLNISVLFLFLFLKSIHRCGL